MKIDSRGKWLLMLLKFSNVFSRVFLTRAFIDFKSKKMPSAIVVLPPGAEEMEFVGSVDVLRRAGVRELKKIFR